MSRRAQPAQVVPLRASKAPKQPTRLQLTRALAKAMAKQDRAEALLREAKAEVSAAFGPWSAGRTINRDEAREQLISTGFLPERKVWEK